MGKTRVKESQRGRPERAQTIGPDGEQPASGKIILTPFFPVAAVVLLVVLAVHWPGLHAGALSFDDGEYLTDNVLVSSPSLGHAWRFLREVLEPSTVHGYYQPLTMISLMVDDALGGRPDHLLPFHRTSLLLHLANTLLIMWLLYLLFENALAAGLVGLVFGVHPVTVETIVWVGERKTVLAAFFALLSIISYVQYAKKGRRWAFVISLSLFVLALMSKPTVTPLPVCLFLLDFWPLNRMSRRALLDKIPFLLVALFSAFITFESQRRTAVAVLPGQQDSIFIPYVVCHNIVFYLWKFVCPIRLSSNYAFPSPMSISHPAIAAGVIGTAILIPLLVVSLRWTRALAGGWLFFFFAVFPTLGVIGFTNVIAADKYAYWPMLGFLLPLAWGLSRIVPPKSGLFDAKAKAIVAAGVLAACALGLTTRSYLRHWTTTESLFRYMLSLDDNAAAPTIYLALELDRQGRTAEALPLHRKAALLAPQFEGAHYNLGNALQKLNDPDGAIAAYQDALRAKPDFADAFNNMGNALLMKGDVARARAAYERAIQLAPGYADAHYNLANVLVRENSTTAAIEHYEATIRLKPEYAAAHKNLATILWEMGRFGPAIEHYGQALLLQPGWWDVAVRLSEFMAEGPDPAFHRPQRAVELAQHAVEVTGGRNPDALVALAVACDRAVQPDQAASAARQAYDLAVAAGDQDLVGRIQQRLGRYLAPAPSLNPGGR